MPKMGNLKEGKALFGCEELIIKWFVFVVRRECGLFWVWSLK